MPLALVQRGFWPGWSPNADIYLDDRAAAAFFTAARDYMKETGRAMPEIVEPMGGLRTVAETTEMQWAFDYGPHGMYAAAATAAQKARSAALYTYYNMSMVSTARPAITGTHTTGLYFDVATLAFLTWILAGNGPRYGITRPLPNDPNHCKVSPGTATVALDVTSLDNSTPITKGNTMTLHVISDATLPNQPAPGGPYNPAHPELTGGNYGLLNDATGRYVQIIGSQKQIEMLEAFIAAPAGTTYVPVATAPQTDAQNAAWLKALCASVGTTAVPIDVAAFAKTLAPLLDTVTEADLVAALATIKFPTKGTVELA